MRNAYEIALEFVTEQSCGEWTDADIKEDARKLADLICTDRDVLRNRCADMVRNGCLVPPDGGSPTTAEVEMCDGIAARVLRII